MKLFIKASNGRYAPAEPQQIHEAHAEYVREQYQRGKQIRSPSDSRDYFAAELRHEPHEIFCALFLDNRHRITSFEKLFHGTIDNTTVYPREVVRRAMHNNAAAVILGHNHPSGIAEPSEADGLITRRVRSALELVDVRVLDHLIVGADSVTSMASRGLM